ncbi:hypothetical protein [Yersinia massiliensis]|uniref:hypothetical protein n=1 Tax=Yersinia massiliensis TaxID=419257 RepID=UPI00131F4506|nr:hypothetical protein [Yersinia massiliensis]QKJ09591.1 hypothetical protein HRD68_01835 [Yersinia massiliensis]
MSSKQYSEVKEVVGSNKANPMLADGWELINTYSDTLKLDDGITELLVIYVLGKPA